MIYQFVTIIPSTMLVREMWVYNFQLYVNVDMGH